MIAAAERLAGDRHFLRVDFYEHEGRALFGEFCLYPGSGLDPFSPGSLDLWLGSRWAELSLGAFVRVRAGGQCVEEYGGRTRART